MRATRLTHVARARTYSRYLALLIGAGAALGWWSIGADGAPTLPGGALGAERGADPGAAARSSNELASPPSCGQSIVPRRLRQQLADDALAIATWNLRWFPRGTPPEQDPSPPDLEQVACAIAELAAPVVAVQEILGGSEFRLEHRRLLAMLDRLRPGSSHRLILDTCPDDRQHVGIIFDSDRLELLDQQVEAQLNPLGSACAGSLRPGLRGTFRTPRGETFDVIVLHLDSGVREADYEHRRRTLEALSQLDYERPTLVVGDLNTMGCDSCSPPISAAQERSSLADLTGLGWVPLQQGCTQYFRGRAGWLDHMLVFSPPGRDLLADLQGLVLGPCAELSCGPLEGPARRFYEELSDHCPLRAAPR